MTDSAYTHLVILADRTGSMGAPTESGRTKASDTTVGIHSLINRQAELPGKLTVSLIQFMSVMGRDSNHIDRVAWFAAPQTPEWQKIRTWTCAPYGNTPLVDAVGTAITDTGFELSQLPEASRPGKVIFVIATDGEENSSKEYTLDSVKTMVTRQESDYSWQFVFIGVDIDGFRDGSRMGFAYGTTLSNTGADIGSTYQVLHSAVARSRASGQSVTFTDDERTVANSE
jgi:hypothetical protein